MLDLLPRYVAYSGNGVTHTFAITFGFFEIRVYIDGDLVDPANYTLDQEAPGDTSNITFIDPDNPPDTDAPANGTVIEVIGVTEPSQDVDLQSGVPFNPTSVERQLDRIVMSLQEFGLYGLEPKRNPNTIMFVDENGEYVLDIAANRLPAFAGPQGDQGDQGIQGFDGTDPGFLFDYSETPDDGCASPDDVDLSAATYIRFSKTTRGGSDVSARLLELDPSSSQLNTLVLTDPITETQASWLVLSASEDGDYVDVFVSDHSGATSFEEGPISVQREMAGPAGSSDVTPVGVVLDYFGTTPPTGWLFVDGKTIGNGSSGATSRANADTESLFTLLWNSLSNTELPIQDSAGGASTRGANAATDFAANKRLPVVDGQGRVFAGKGDMSGTSANRLTGLSGGVNGDTLGAVGGAETHALTEAQLAVHDHDDTLSVSLSNATLVVRGTLGGSMAAGEGATFVSLSPLSNVTIAATVNGAVSNAGSGEAHNNVQPTIIANKIIRYAENIIVDADLVISAKNSIEINDDELQLVGDTASPGNNKVYGTDGSGVRGWKDDPSGADAKNSIEVDADELQLVGDEASPGNNKVYGTDGSGNKGWKDDPAGGGIGKNALINGSMRVAQRGTSFTSTGSANNDDVYVLDRWNLLSDGNDIVDVTQATDAPAGALFSMGLDVETVNKKFGVLQIIEQKNCADLIGQTVVLSAYLKVTNATRLDKIKMAIVAWDGAADTVTSDIVSAWGVDGTNPTLVANWTYENTPADLGVTTSWARYSVSAVVDTASAKNIGVFIWSDNVTDTDLGDILYVANAKLELGSSPTAFQTPSIVEELDECLRYYMRLTSSGTGTRIANGTALTTTNSAILFPNLRLRTTPTIAGTAGLTVADGGATPTVTALTLNWSGSTLQVGAEVASGLTAAHAVQLRLAASTDYFEIMCEL